MTWVLLGGARNAWERNLWAIPRILNSGTVPPGERRGGSLTHHTRSQSTDGNTHSAHTQKRALTYPTHPPTANHTHRCTRAHRPRPLMHRPPVTHRGPTRGPARARAQVHTRRTHPSARAHTASRAQTRAPTLRAHPLLRTHKPSRAPALTAQRRGAGRQRPGCPAGRGQERARRGVVPELFPRAPGRASLRGSPASSGPAALGGPEEARHGPQGGWRRGGGLRGLWRRDRRVSRTGPAAGGGRSPSDAATLARPGTFLDPEAEPKPERLWRDAAAGAAPPARVPRGSRRGRGELAPSRARPEGRAAWCRLLGSGRAPPRRAGQWKDSSSE